jgi:hypothetical protein
MLRRWCRCAAVVLLDARSVGVGAQLLPFVMLVVGLVVAVVVV